MTEEREGDCDRALREAAIYACQRAIDALASGDAAPTTVLDRLTRELTRAESRRLGEGPVQAYDAVRRTFESLQERYGPKPIALEIATGLAVFDGDLGGLHAGQLLLLEGKGRVCTHLIATHLACSLAESGCGTMLRTFGTPLVTLVQRMFEERAHTIGVPSAPSDWDRFVGVAGELSQAPLWLVTDGAATVAALERDLDAVAGPKLQLLVVLDADWLRGGPLLGLRRLRRLARERNLAVVATTAWTGEALNAADGGPDWRIFVEPAEDDRLRLSMFSGDEKIAHAAHIRIGGEWRWVDVEGSNRDAKSRR